MSKNLKINKEMMAVLIQDSQDVQGKEKEIMESLNKEN